MTVVGVTGFASSATSRRLISADLARLIKINQLEPFICRLSLEFFLSQLLILPEESTMKSRNWMQRKRIVTRCILIGFPASLWYFLLVHPGNSGIEKIFSLLLMEVKKSIHNNRHKFHGPLFRGGLEVPSCCDCL